MRSNRVDPVKRTAAMHSFDRECGADVMVTAGVDEAGRGPLAGPVVAAAVCFDYNKPLPHIDDSKKLSEKQREELYVQITEVAVAWGVGTVSPEEIDRINILQATYKAMSDAVLALAVDWQLLLVDGNRAIPTIALPRQKTIVGGDAKSAAIAAASIIAKVTRDHSMVAYHEQFPQYDFARHKGYGTKAHCDALRKYGLTSIHRKSFCSNLIMQTELVF